MGDALTVERICANFEILGDWDERYGYLIDLGRKLPEMSADEKTEENRVRGCQATVWLKERVPEESPARLEFNADSDALMVRGLIAILLAMYSGKTAQDILDVDAPAVFARLGLDQHLSVTRRNGLFSMVERIRGTAARFLSASGAAE